VGALSAPLSTPSLDSSLLRLAERVETRPLQHSLLRKLSTSSTFPLQIVLPSRFRPLLPHLSSFSQLLAGSVDNANLHSQSARNRAVRFRLFRRQNHLDRFSSLLTSAPTRHVALDTPPTTSRSRILVARFGSGRKSRSM
jgi:hypothetical protein